ncbi:MAG TPA: Sua5/YciO/YrdC/YwlC family protein, partial [Thermoanaerobaculia bacterium]|nr:Sua5/YciO/YrdC/YwlC family protein [Thermoanaerobaculia bacterium]
MKRWTLDENLPLDEVADALRAGGVLLLPTDTIYGLHAIAANAEAVAKIQAMKGRDDTKPFIVLAASIEQLPELGVDAPAALAELWPAPLTVILPLTLERRAPSPAEGSE